MRKLVYAALGFGIACCMAVWVLTREQLLLPAVILTVLSIFLLLPGREYPVFRKTSLLLLGCGLGFFWYLGFYHFYLTQAVSLDYTTQECTIRTSDYSYQTGYGIAVDGILYREGKSYPVRAYLEPGEELIPGTILEGSFRFRVTTPDGAQAATTHSGKGIFLLAYQEKELTIRETGPDSLREKASVLRRKIGAALKENFPVDVYPFAQALLLGDTGELSYEVDTDLKISGIRHVAAVSGLHVSILFALLSVAALRRRFLTAILGLPALLLFAAVAGFTPSVTRACIMSALMIGALLLNREYDGPTALSFAVMVMLCVNPHVITSVSFQLSVASVAGIFLFTPRIHGWLSEKLGNIAGKSIRAKLSRWLAGSVSVSLGAMVLTTPFSVWYFGTVSLIGVVTNLLTMWVISFAFYGIMAVCMVSLFWKSAAAVLAWLTAWPIRYVLGCAKLLADFPLAAVYTESIYIAAWVLFAYLLLAIFCLNRRKRPTELFCCACLGLCAALLASWWSPKEEVKISVLDVGQGQSILLQSEGRAFLVDCGGDSDTMTADIAAEALLSQGINCLDGMILTHGDYDHAGAAANFLSRMDTGVLILPPFAGLQSQLKAQEIIYAGEDLSLSWGSTVLTVFAPDFPGNSNENSLCILFDTPKCDILITGDRNAFGERMLLRFQDIPDVDILVAGHHGAESSTCEELLQAVRPEIVCISVGEDNSYGHPAPALLQRLAAYGCAVYRTDESGTITIRR